MKERPILFSGEMVRAILAGRKTQTRRVCNWQPQENASIPHFIESMTNRCRYGHPGDRLWVKETHLPKASGIIYRADFDPVEAAGLGGMYGGWKPSIFMRRTASRITLEIVAVRVERLQAINEADAKAEGVQCENSIASDRYWPTYKDAYKTLWEIINGDGSWALNPWVWVIEFKKL